MNRVDSEVLREIQGQIERSRRAQPLGSEAPAACAFTPSQWALISYALGMYETLCNVEFERQKRGPPPKEPEWERLPIVLAYATGALLESHRARSPEQLSEDQKKAAACWELAEQVNRWIRARVLP